MPKLGPYSQTAILSKLVLPMLPSQASGMCKIRIAALEAAMEMAAPQVKSTAYWVGLAACLDVLNALRNGDETKLQQARQVASDAGWLCWRESGGLWERHNEAIVAEHFLGPYLAATEALRATSDVMVEAAQREIARRRADAEAMGRLDATARVAAAEDCAEAAAWVTAPWRHSSASGRSGCSMRFLLSASQRTADTATVTEVSQLI